MISKHNAAEQMLGYLYQISYALKLLFESDDLDYQLSIERFDDIAFDKDNDPKKLIQLKHHSKPASLTDSSVDLWRTLGVWIDAINYDSSLLKNTDFVIITTAEVPSNSASEAIQNNDYRKAFECLKAVAEKSENKANVSAYSKFKSLREPLILSLIRRIKIISSSIKIIDIEKSIQKLLFYSCKPEFIPKVLERVEGWWYQECVKALSSSIAVITTKRQLQSIVLEISRQYGDDSLPIEFWNIDEVEEADLDPKDRIFLEQLRLLQSQNRTLRLAINDYYRASKERSSWLRQGLVFANDLDFYEHQLIDAWKHAFAEMEERLSEYGVPTEQEKIKEGKVLYSNLMGKEIRIRPGVCVPYVMNGTYHHIANSLKIGWHVDFLDKLKHLLNEANQE